MNFTVESYRGAFAEALLELGEKLEHLVVLDADVARSTMTKKFAERFPHRFIQVGISEQDLVGTAAGLAIAGKLPLVSAFSMFLMRAWEQIRNTVARDRLNVKFVATHAGLSDYLDGSSHQSLEDIAIMRVIPNMNVVVPADAVSTRKLLFEIFQRHGPAYMRIGRDYAPRVYEDESEIKMGKINRLEDGDDVCIAACGVMTAMALHAAKILKKRGINAAVIDVHTIKPLDRRTLINMASRTGAFVAVEEHNIFGGLGSAILEEISEEYPVRMKRVGIRDTFGTCSRDYVSLLKHYGLDIESIVRAAEEVVK
ncbi:MAG: transketolase family protein [Candidatus Baldrarchaeia archaeon]